MKWTLGAAACVCWFMALGLSNAAFAICGTMLFCTAALLEGLGNK